jgi:hypothetical protein
MGPQAGHHIRKIVADCGDDRWALAVQIASQSKQRVDAGDMTLLRARHAVKVSTMFGAPPTAIGMRLRPNDIRSGVARCAESCPSSTRRR